MAATTFLNRENLVESTLDGAIGAGDGTLDVAAGTAADFGATDFHIVVGDTSQGFEIMKVTNVAGDTLTITRAVENVGGAAGVALPFDDGTAVRMAITDQYVQDAYDAINNIEDGTTRLTSVTGDTDSDLVIGADLDLILRCDLDGDGANKISFHNGADAEVGYIDESGDLVAAGFHTVGDVYVGTGGTADGRLVFGSDEDVYIHNETADTQLDIVADGGLNTSGPFTATGAIEAGGTGFHTVGDVYVGTGGTADGRVYFGSDEDVYISNTTADTRLDIAAGAGVYVSADLHVGDGLTVTGNTIHDSAGAWITSDGAANTTLAGTLHTADDTIIGGTALKHAFADLEVQGNLGALSIVSDTNDTVGSAIYGSKSVNGAIVTNNTYLLDIKCLGHDGTDYDTIGARIAAKIAGTPAANRMPTNLVFSTAPGVADNDLAIAMVLDKNKKLILYGDLVLENDVIQDSGGTWLSSDGAGNTTLAGTLHTADDTIIGGTALKNTNSDCEVQGNLGVITLIRDTDDIQAPQLIGYKSHNDAIVTDNDRLLEIQGQGYDGVNYNTIGARMRMLINGTPVGNRLPTDIEFWTAQGVGDDDIAIALTIGKDKNLTVVGDVIVQGDNIQDSGGTWLLSDGAGNTTLAGTLDVGDTSVGNRFDQDTLRSWSDYGLLGSADSAALFRLDLTGTPSNWSGTIYGYILYNNYTGSSPAGGVLFFEITYTYKDASTKVIGFSYCDRGHNGTSALKIREYATDQFEVQYVGPGWFVRYQPLIYWKSTQDPDFSVFDDSPTSAGSLVTPNGTLTLPNDLSVGGVLSTSTVTTFTADDTTPPVTAGNVFKVPATWTAGHDITAFDDGVMGQTIHIIGGDTDCNVVDGGTLKLNGNWNAAADATLTLLYDGSNWYELSRSAN